MSIIERVASMLGPVPDAGQEPQAVDKEKKASSPNLIERAAGKSGRMEALLEKGIPPALVAAPEVAPKVGKVSQTVTINMDNLRRAGMITPDGERTEITEGFRRAKRHLIANIVNRRANSSVNLIMVTSSVPGEGKTFCAVNLAISIAMEMDHTVLLVDADVARPSIPAVLGFRAGAGLMDVLLDGRVDLADVLVKTDIEKLTILPAGTAHHRATELLASEAMRILLQEMAQRYSDRVIIFDSPPLLVASEAGVLASHMGQIVIVVEAGKTPQTSLKDALGRIESCDNVGLLLNKGTTYDTSYYRKYYSGYGA